MKKSRVWALALVAGVVVAGWWGSVAAQRPDPTRPFVAPSLLLQGPGATIGVSVRDQPPEAGSAGALVVEVREGSPAAAADIRAGDVVIAFDGERTRSARNLSRLVEETAPGRQVEVTVLRDGSRVTLSVTPQLGRAGAGIPDQLWQRIEPFPQEFGRYIDLFPGGAARLGVLVTPLSTQLAEHFGVARGVLISEVEADSPAARAGMRAGDVITRVDTREVSQPADVSRAVREADAGATLEVQLTRDKRELGVQVQLPGRRSTTREGGRPI